MRRSGEQKSLDYKKNFSYCHFNIKHLSYGIKKLPIRLLYFGNYCMSGRDLGFDTRQTLTNPKKIEEQNGSEETSIRLGLYDMTGQSTPKKRKKKK